MTMAYTANLKLAKPGHNDDLWDQPIRDNYDELDSLNALGDLAVTPTEVPSSSLNVKVSSGVYVAQDGTVATFAGSSSQAVPTATTSVLFLDMTVGGVLVVDVAYPTRPHVRLATVLAGATSISSITDDRLAYRVCGGTIGDGINMSFGTATGTKIGTAPTQKLGFWNAAPVVQPAGANQGAVTDSTGGVASFTLAAVTATNTADVSAIINNDLASLARAVAAIRTALVAAGVMKGSA